MSPSSSRVLPLCLLLLYGRQSPPRRLCTAALLAALIMEPQANAVRNRHHKGHELQREGHEDAKLEAQCAERALLQEIVRAPGEPYADHASDEVSGRVFRHRVNVMLLCLITRTCMQSSV